MEVEVAPTKKIVIFGVEKRKTENLVWCAVTYGVNRLFWVDGYLLCLEVYEKSFEHEIKSNIFPISQLCYAEFPNYIKIYEAEKGVQIPIVNASDTKLYQTLLKAVLKHEKPNLVSTSEKRKNCNCSCSVNTKRFRIVY